MVKASLNRLFRGGAEVRYDAGLASRFARLADIAPVQDQPVVGVQPEGGGDDLFEAKLDGERGLADGERLKIS